MAVFATGIAVTGGVAGDSTKTGQSGIAQETLEGTILPGHSDALSGSDVPFDVPAQGAELNFDFEVNYEALWEEVAVNKGLIAALTADVEQLDKSAADYAARHESLMSKILAYEERNSEIMNILARAGN